MSFRLVLKLVTLNDTELRNSPNLCIISPYSVDFGADYVKVVEDTPILCRRNVGQRIYFWRYVTYGDIGRGLP